MHKNTWNILITGFAASFVGWVMYFIAKLIGVEDPQTINHLCLIASIICWPVIWHIYTKNEENELDV